MLSVSSARTGSNNTEINYSIVDDISVRCSWVFSNTWQVSMSSGLIEVEFEHRINVMTDEMDEEDCVLVVVSADVTPFDAGAGCIFQYGEIDITSIEVVDPRYPDLEILEDDITSDEYDKIEDHAYRIANESRDYDGYFH